MNKIDARKYLKNNPSLLGALFLIAIVILWNFNRRNNIVSRMALLKGNIYSVEQNKNSGPIVRYEYYYKGKTYKSSQFIKKYNTGYLNKNYVVAIDSLAPNEGTLLMYKENFDLIGLEPEDSLITSIVLPLVSSP